MRPPPDEGVHRASGVSTPERDFVHREEHTMTTEQAKQLSEDAIARLMQALEQGQSDALKNYLAVMSRFHRYSWGNCLLIYSQRPQATHIAGFHAWLKLRRYVRKGEKGIVILAPMVGKKKSEEELSEDAHTRLFGFRAAHVFDVSQTEGDPLPEFATTKGDPQEFTERLKHLSPAKGIALEYYRRDRTREGHVVRRQDHDSYQPRSSRTFLGVGPRDRTRTSPSHGTPQQDHSYHPRDRSRGRCVRCVQRHRA